MLKKLQRVLKEGRYGFEETAYLLLCGSLPNKRILQNFKDLLSDAQSMKAEFARKTVMQIPSKDIMNVLGRGVLSLYSIDKNADDISIENVLRQSIELLAFFLF